MIPEDLVDLNKKPSKIIMNVFALCIGIITISLLSSAILGALFFPTEEYYEIVCALVGIIVGICFCFVTLAEVFYEIILKRAKE
jgi:uncharacterized membrane protein YgaE (UPF0421/DUF939 family)